ncbi:hypothetical protein V8C26DRAFT_353537 [Trichoderma gracile]
MVGKMSEYLIGGAARPRACSKHSRLQLPNSGPPSSKQCTVTTCVFTALVHWVGQACSTKRALCIFAAVGRDRGSGREWFQESSPSRPNIKFACSHWRRKTLELYVCLQCLQQTCAEPGLLLELRMTTYQQQPREILTVQAYGLRLIFLPSSFPPFSIIIDFPSAQTTGTAYQWREPSIEYECSTCGSVPSSLSLNLVLSTCSRTWDLTQS